ncbi:NAD-dependent epimerase/dehydratase family protein [Corallococcus sp. 4LFB]|uniref:NAD-dependent epimerase/dehydratase family protein n=1 Tax=Corallococcus sp. 4LFB TaxID=3383249 RepID=UPI00397537CB
MNVLVTGATGLIGNAIAQRLVKQGASVRELAGASNPPQHSVCWSHLGVTLKSRPHQTATVRHPSSKKQTTTNPHHQIKNTKST